ncbi:hypothetical protein EDC32_1011261 [Laceyella sacchari]|jgi:hypothetical protein|uniref:hypothetical protein n=1 Tax=Laceyella sacchari TaxID=37482 RepID=UPI00104ADA0D|nr:hypothetical protein [Laceyella sacchari]TCW41595.1 hypothetical protein EDC32_1011261 [Laceyella sacchari]
MKAEWIKKPKVWIPTVIVAASLGTLPFWLPDNKADKNDITPDQVVIQFENAQIQKDGVKIKELATPDYAKLLADLNNLSLNQGKQNNETLPDNWVAEEYRVNENLYVYHIKWVNELKVNVGGHYRVEKKNDKWQINYLPGNEFDLMIQGLTPRILKGTDH